MTHAKSRWIETIERDPEHSVRYADRFERMAREGADLAGEARLIDAMVERGARILDAGSGTGRVGGYLADRGHTVVGVDVDPYLIGRASGAHPNATWLTLDLVELDLDQRFDVIVCAGNVMSFLHPTTRVEVLMRFVQHLTPNGRVVVGFGAGRGYDFDDFFADVNEAGLVCEARFSTWDLRPFVSDSAFLVAIASNAATAAATQSSRRAGSRLIPLKAVRRTGPEGS